MNNVWNRFIKTMISVSLKRWCNITIDVLEYNYFAASLLKIGQNDYEMIVNTIF